MISRALNSDNDLLLDGGRIAVTRDGAQVAQAVRCRLQFFKGEWFLDTEAGVPWYQDILTRPVVLANVDALLKREILQTEGVEALLEYAAVWSRTTRRLSVRFTARTTYGEIIADDVYLNI